MQLERCTLISLRVLGQVSHEKGIEEEILCKKFIGECSWEKLLQGSKGSRIRQKLNSSAFGREDTIFIMRSYGAGRALKICPKLKQGGQVFVSPHLPSIGCGLSLEREET